MNDFNVENIKALPLRKIIIFVGILIGIILSMSFAGGVGETNKAGWVQIKQAAITGDLTVRKTPGFYWQLWGSITDYEMAGNIFLSKDNADGGNSNKSERVLFPNGFADVNFVGMYQLMLEDEKLKAIHIRFNNDPNFKYMVKQQIIEALKNTGTLMSAEEAYSSKRSDFTRLAREQALYGLYKSKVITDSIIDVSGQMTERKFYSVAKDSDGQPIVTKPSLLAEYGVTLPQFNIKDMDFDPKLMGLIESRKDAQKAKQDAITSKAKGESQIAEQKATQEVLKIKEVTITEKEAAVAKIDAEKKFKVAQYKAKQAQEEKKATIAKGQAEAEANRLKVKAGLSPQEKAEWNYKTKVGIAAELAKVKMPEIVMSGGGDGNNSALDGLGIKFLMEINEKLSK